jgi:hypothetical protein
MPTEFVDYYKMLNLAKTATQQEIEEAYKTRLAKARADERGRRGQQMSEDGMSADELEVLYARREFQLLQAYNTLSNSAYRKLYDEAFETNQARQFQAHLADEAKPWVGTDPIPFPLTEWQYVEPRVSQAQPSPFTDYLWDRPFLPLLVIAVAALVYALTNNIIVIPGVTVPAIYNLGVLLLLAGYVLMYMLASATIFELQLDYKAIQFSTAIAMLAGALVGLLFVFAAPSTLPWPTTMLLSVAGPVFAVQMFKQRHITRPGNSFSLPHVALDFVVLTVVAGISQTLVPDAPLAVWLSVWAFLTFVFRM